MKTIKLFSILIIISFFATMNIDLARAQDANDTSGLANVSAEFEVDDIDADSLNIDAIDTLPGEFKYNWQIFKENVGLFFTFDQEKKLEKLEEISHRRLLETKALAENGSDNAADRITQTLDRYNQVREQISQRLSNNPELQEKVLKKLDANQLKHQEVLSAVEEKLRDKLPEEDLAKIENIKRINVLRWYEINKDQIQQRLANSVEDNNVGSKFRQLKNIAVLEELEEELPEEARDKVAAAKTRAEERLAERLENFEAGDREKIEKYINNIATPEIIKQKFISNLKDSQNLPSAIKERTASMFDKYSDDIIYRFSNMSQEEQADFLKQFEDSLEGHPAYIRLLENLKDNEQYRDRIDDILETQTQRLKEDIQKIDDPIRLRVIEQNLSDDPVIKRQIQDQQRKIQANPTLAPQR